MLYWIFDLDNTLYQLPDNTQFSYKYIKKDSQLNYLLDNLPLKKLIFTNGTYGHAKLCLEKMQCNSFDNITARDIINDLKPNTISYLKFMKVNKITKKDKCIFFDDLPENLIEAKKYNWITVLIGSNYMHPDIDLSFPNIYVALYYFLNKIKN